jgi:hypothetical protein
MSKPTSSASLQRQFQHLLQSGHALRINTRDVGVVDDGDEAVHFHMLMEKSRELVAECAGTTR